MEIFHENGNKKEGWYKNIYIYINIYALKQRLEQIQRKELYNDKEFNPRIGYNICKHTCI